MNKCKSTGIDRSELIYLPHQQIKYYTMKNYTSVSFWPQLFSILKYEIENRSWDHISEEQFIDQAFRLPSGKIISLLIEIPIICEGFLKTLIQHKVFETNPDSFDKETLEDDTSNSWSKLHGVFNKTFPKKFKVYCDNEDAKLFDDLQNLFMLRNLLGHGQDVAIEYEIQSHGNVKVEIREAKFSKVSDHLHKRGIIKDDQMTNIALLQDENVLMFYYEVCKRFLSLKEFRKIKSIDVIFEQVYRNLN